MGCYVRLLVCLWSLWCLQLVEPPSLDRIGCNGWMLACIPHKTVSASALETNWAYSETQWNKSVEAIHDIHDGCRFLCKLRIILHVLLQERVYSVAAPELRTPCSWASRLNTSTAWWFIHTQNGEKAFCCQQSAKSWALTWMSCPFLHLCVHHTMSCKTT